MSSTKTSSSGKGFIHYFRSTIKFLERLFRNIWTQIKWISKESKNAYSNIISWHEHKFGAPGFWKYVYTIVITIVSVFIVFPFLIIWSGLKSF